MYILYNHISKIDYDYNTFKINQCIIITSLFYVQLFKYCLNSFLIQF